MSWQQGQSYSPDLAERVLAAVDEGSKVRVASSLFKVSISYIYKAQKRRRETGQAGPRPGRGHPRRKLVGHEKALLAKVETEPDTTIEELRTFVLEEFGVSISTGGMWYTLDRLGLTFKKNRTRRRTGSS